MGRGIVKTGKALEKLLVGREGAIQVCREAKIKSPEFKAANQVVESIDELATSLTGKSGHFHLGGHGSQLMPLGDDDGPLTLAEEYEALCYEFGEKEARETAASELAKAEAAEEPEQIRYWSAVLAFIRGDF